MPKTLDVLIGVATVMLLFSMAVTVITQFITSVAGSRGRNLRNGLASLLRQLDPGLDQKISGAIATAVLKHSLIAGPLGRLGSVVHREELTTLLMELAAGQTPDALDQNVKTSLTQLLKKNGIDDPGKTLSNVRAVALQLEASNPELANHARNSMAILQEAKSEYVGKINAWFDQTVDRVSQRFTFSARRITVIGALVVTLGVQLDVIALVNRLSLDDAFRDSVKVQAQQLMDKAVAGGSGTTSGGSADSGKTDQQSGSKPSDITQNNQQNPPPVPKASPKESRNNQQDKAIQSEYYNLLSTAGLIVMPADSNWKSRWDWHRLPGILLSAFLLSLGAPFWYNALQNLLRLRSSLAQKDDQQRALRQQTQPDATQDGDGPATIPEVLQGERGNLKAVG